MNYNKITDNIDAFFLAFFYTILIGVALYLHAQGHELGIFIFNTNPIFTELFILKVLILFGIYYGFHFFSESFQASIEKDVEPTMVKVYSNWANVCLVFALTLFAIGGFEPLKKVEPSPIVEMPSAYRPDVEKLADIIYSHAIESSALKPMRADHTNLFTVLLDKFYSSLSLWKFLSGLLVSFLYFKWLLHVEAPCIAGKLAEKAEKDECEDDCECAECLDADDEVDLEDAFDFIRSKDLYADFREFQDARSEERENRNAW